MYIKENNEEKEWEAFCEYTGAHREEHGFLAHWGVTEVHGHEFNSFEDWCPMLPLYNLKVILSYYWPNYGLFPLIPSDDGRNALPTHKEPVPPIEVPVVGDTWHDLYKSTDAAVRISGDHHHIFIEGYTLNDEGNLVIEMGS